MVQHRQDVGIPFLDLPRLHASIRGALDAAYASVVDGPHLVGSAAVASFEARLADIHGLSSAASCGSGTDAITLALRALGVGAGHEVVVPALTFVGTAEAVVHAGATPVLADVDPESLLLTAVSAEPAMSVRTRAVLPVHLYGHVVAPADIDAWRGRGLVVVEDAAQAVLGAADGMGIGTRSDAACLSFYPSKNLGALGDGGAVLAGDPAVGDAVASLRDHGLGAGGTHEAVGWCSRLDGLQAAFLEAKLTHLPAWTMARRRIAERYRQLLADHVVPWRVGAVHHQVVVRLPERDAVAAALASRGIETHVHYPHALSELPSLSPWARSCPVAEHAAGEVLSLPADPLMSDDEVDRCAAAVLDALGA